MQEPDSQSIQSREFGDQPIDQLLSELGLSNHDLVRASSEQLTHKMVAKARRGRWLSSKVRCKIQRALNKASGQNYAARDLFNY
ncbi:MAG: hypothetical protein WCT05_13190 [Lentisphaeria bacterium]